MKFGKYITLIITIFILPNVLAATVLDYKIDYIALTILIISLLASLTLFILGIIYIVKYFKTKETKFLIKFVIFMVISFAILVILFLWIFGFFRIIHMLSGNKVGPYLSP